MGKEEDDVIPTTEEQLDIADQIKDDLVPLALEYYLGVIEIDDDSDDDFEDMDDDGKKKKGGDSDEDGDDKKKKKPYKAKGKKGKMPPGMDGADCKQQ